MAPGVPIPIPRAELLSRLQGKLAGQPKGASRQLVVGWWWEPSLVYGCAGQSDKQSHSVAPLEESVRSTTSSWCVHPRNAGAPMQSGTSTHQLAVHGPLLHSPSRCMCIEVAAVSEECTTTTRLACTLCEGACCQPLCMKSGRLMGHMWPQAAQGANARR
jgi:hypothetical protein